LRELEIDRAHGVDSQTSVIIKPEILKDLRIETEELPKSQSLEEILKKHSMVRDLTERTGRYDQTVVWVCVGPAGATRVAKEIAMMPYEFWETVEVLSTSLEKNLKSAHRMDRTELVSHIVVQ
jgi:hypothetical protein